MASRTRILHVRRLGRHADRLERAAAVLREGGLVAFPTETVYGLAVRADCESAVRRLYEVKGRAFSKPLSVHLADPEEAGDYVGELPEAARSLMRVFWPGPLTLLMRRSRAVPEAIVRGTDKVGLRLPDHALARAFLRRCGVTVAATSANLSGRPSPTTVEHVLSDLEGRIDCLLVGKKRLLGLESTVLDVTGNPPRVVRLGFVTVEEISRVLGRPPLLSGDTATPERFTRFAPEARLVVVEGHRDRVPRRLRLLREDYAISARVALLVTRETAQAHFPGDEAVRQIGSRQDLEAIARELFRLLRRLETEEGVQIVLVEGLPREGLGAAIMERLDRVAHQVINTEDPGYAGRAGAGEPGPQG